MLIAPLLIAAVLVIAFPRLMRFILGLFVFGALFVIASCIDHAHAQDLNTQNHETLVRYAGYFASCAKGSAVHHHDEFHKMKMLGGDPQSAVILNCDQIANGYVHWCITAGHDEASCYGDLRFIAEDVLRQAGN